MDNYLEYAHNLSGSNTFEKFGKRIKSAIAFNFVRQLDDFNSLQKAVISESNNDVLQYISEHLDLGKYYKNVIFTTNRSSYVEDVDFNNIRAIINLRKINNIRKLNKLFRSINSLLPDAGIFVGRLETYGNRKELLYKRFGSKLGKLFWLIDFVLNRITPRIPYLESLYYYFTKGQFHAFSRAEIMGRLIYCGFETLSMKTINGLSYFVAMKLGDPMTHQHPSFYPIIKLVRVGKGGKMFGVYKFRTMHPYSEYLQDYIIKLNGYNDKGKPANDFRVTHWGKFMRKLWIDELPQIINVLKGEMKLVGLRPISMVRFGEFPEDLRVERVKYKPGCFPPYVALNMPDDKENIEAERIYINELKKQHRITVDVRYFFLSVYNIFTNKIRSS